MPERDSRPKRRATIGIVASLGLGAIYLWLTRSSADDRFLFFDAWRARDMLVALAAVATALACACRLVSRKFLLAGMFTAALAVATLGLLEVAGAVGLVSYPRMFGTSCDVLGSTVMKSTVVSGDSFEDLAYAWGYPVTPIPFEYRTDRRGYRNARDHAAPSLVLLGDSILVAGLVPAEQTVAGRLEDALGVPTSNIALIGLSVARERAELNRAIDAGMPLEGRLVLQFVFEGNDLIDSVGDRADQPELSWRERSLTNNILLRLQRASDPTHPASMRRIGRTGDQSWLFMWGEQSFRGLEDEFDNVARVLSDVRRRVEARGGRYGVVFIPMKMRVVGARCTWPAESSIRDAERHIGWFRDRIVAWGRESRTPLLDSTGALCAAAAGGRFPWFEGDTHPNGVGHQIIARAILDWPVMASWMQMRRTMELAR